MKKLLLIIALTLTANAQSLCDMYITETSSHIARSTVEMQYGKGYMAKLHLKDALHSIISARRFCGSEDFKYLDKAKKAVIVAIKRIDDAKNNTNTSTDIGNEVW